MPNVGRRQVLLTPRPTVTVSAAAFSAVALRQLRGTNELEVRVKLQNVEREDIYSVEEFVLRTPSGAEVPY